MNIIYRNEGRIDRQSTGLALYGLDNAMCASYHDMLPGLVGTSKGRHHTDIERLQKTGRHNKLVIHTKSGKPIVFIRVETYQILDSKHSVYYFS
jgi:hypothetical protein